MKKRLLAVLALCLVASFLAGCSPNKVGEIVGFKFTMGLSDLSDGVVDDADFAGIVVVRLNDGTKINGFVKESLGLELVGGMKLEVAPTDDPELWEVIRIVE